MKNLYTAIICILVYCGCTNSYNQNAATDEYQKEKFDSFLTQFAQFDGKQPDESFFEIRKQFPDEKWCPEISKILFSSYLPCEESHKEENNFCYRPCYKIEKNNFYLVSINRERYSYDDNTLVTYDKKGKIIDFATVGTGSDLEYYKIDTPSKENEIVYTQYCFKDVESAYDGDCDVYVYKVTVEDNGKIEKKLLREEKNMKVTLYNVTY